MSTDRRPPWKKPAPRGTGGTRLTPAQKYAARRRAEDNGRTYPNLVDNMWALRQPTGPPDQA